MTVFCIFRLFFFWSPGEVKHEVSSRASERKTCFGSTLYPIPKGIAFKRARVGHSIEIETRVLAQSNDESAMNFSVVLCEVEVEMGRECAWNEYKVSMHITMQKVYNAIAVKYSKLFCISLYLIPYVCLGALYLPNIFRLYAWLECSLIIAIITI